MVHGNIGESGVMSKDWVFVSDDCQACACKTAHCGDGLLRRANAPDGSVSLTPAVELPPASHKTTFSGNLVWKQLKSSFLVSV